MDRTAELERRIADLEAELAWLRHRGDEDAARKARLGEQRLRQIIDLVPHFVFAKDLDGRFILVNQAVADAYGTTVEELTGRTDADFARSEAEVRHFRADDLEVIEGGRPKLIPVEPITDASGHVRLLETTKIPFTFSGSDRPAILGVSIDITERQRIEGELGERAEQLRFLSENLADGMVYQIDSGLSGAERRFSYLSPAIERLHGLKAETVMRDPSLLYGQVVEDDRPLVAEEEASAFVERRKMEADVRVRLPSGEVRWRRFISTPRTLADGRVVWDGIELDITERRQAEEQQLRLQTELHQARRMESIGRLAGGVAHDFNNLLTVITGNASFALRRLPGDHPLHARLKEIGVAAASAAALTSQLLAFSRRQVVEPRPVDLGQVVTGMQPLLARLIGENIRLEIAAAAGLGAVLIDPGQLEQVVVNLAANARDAMPGGGTLRIETVRLRPSEPGPAHPLLTPSAPRVVLSVSDTGTGISPEVRERLFEPFFTTKPAGQGTGLGLASIYGAVKQAGGDVEVVSQPGHGTTFRLSFPVHPGEAGRLAGGVTDGLPVGGSETILLVEDEQELLRLAALMLRDLGYRVLPAADGPSALSIAEASPEPIHLLLSDVVMPGMNGRQLADRVVRMHPETRVLFTSGYPEDVIAHHGVVDTGLAFLAKPYTHERLADKVRALLDRRE